MPGSTSRITFLAIRPPANSRPPTGSHAHSWPIADAHSSGGCAAANYNPLMHRGHLASLLGRVAGGENLSLPRNVRRHRCHHARRVDRRTNRPAADGLAAKGETVDEVAGAAAAMRRHMTPIRSRARRAARHLRHRRRRLGDVQHQHRPRRSSPRRPACRSPSTATAASPAAAARPTCWPSWASTSNAAVAAVEACLDELGICFCFAPLLHPAMKHVAAVRKQLGIRTIFNILGPLVNPAGAPLPIARRRPAGAAAAAGRRDGPARHRAHARRLRRRRPRRRDARRHHATSRKSCIADCRVARLHLDARRLRHRPPAARRLSGRQPRRQRRHHPPGPRRRSPARPATSSSSTPPPA